jgi:hypothetical protein
MGSLCILLPASCDAGKKMKAELNYLCVFKDFTVYVINNVNRFLSQLTKI